MARRVKQAWPPANKAPARVDVVLYLDPDPDALVMRAMVVRGVRADRVQSTARMVSRMVGLDYYAHTLLT